MHIIQKAFLPILIITPIDDPQCALEALRTGAYNYVVKVPGYEKIINIAIKEAIIKFNEREELKRTVAQLKKRVNELEVKSGIKAPPKTSQKQKVTKKKPTKEEIEGPVLVREIITRFKRGDINLPPVPSIISEFNDTVKRGASIVDVSEVLKRDIGLSTKLINVSNSTYYKRASENKTLVDAISRVGLSDTKQYVYAAANRDLYVSSNSQYKKFLEKLWVHSLACAHSTQITTELLGIALRVDPFLLGLLHDIGILILLEIVGKLAMSEEQFKELNAVKLLSTIMQLHGKFGAVLLKRWNFSSIFIDVACHHDEPNEAKRFTKELLIANFANNISKLCGFPFRINEGITVDDITASGSSILLKINAEQISSISEKVTARVKTSLGLFK